MDPDLPADVAQSLERVAAIDGPAAEVVGQALTRVLRAADALAWARDRVRSLVAAPTQAERLQVVVDEAIALTHTPEAWAITWADGGDLARVVALAGGPGAGRTADGSWLVPAEISRSVLGQVARERRPAWSDDARVDARFLGAESVQALALRSVGCVPIGTCGALYLHDPTTPGRFTAAARARLSALCALAAELMPALEAPADPPVSQVAPLQGLVGTSPAMREVYAAVRAFAPMPWPVLVLGETGTGKEAVARAVHELSGRAGAFVALNCATVGPELADSTLFGHERGAFTGADRARGGLVEAAGAGTLLLDEVGELPDTVQTKLLRLLQEGTYRRVGDERERRFDGRIVAATHRAIDDPAAGFRADLYHRLSACVVRAPPLRDRLTDLPALAEHLLARALGELSRETRLTLSPDALAALIHRPWPGNVRELDNAIKGGVARALARGSPSLGPEDLAPRSRAAATEGDWPADLMAATEQFQQHRVRHALSQAGDNKTRAAELLGVSRQWLHRLIARWDHQGSW